MSRIAEQFTGSFGVESEGKDVSGCVKSINFDTGFRYRSKSRGRY